MNTRRETFETCRETRPSVSTGKRRWRFGGLWAVVLAVGWAWSALGDAADAAEAGLEPEHVRQIDLIHFSHTDYGFTDHPAVCRDLQRRYLDIALDAARATRHYPDEARFRWTAETTVAVDDWWQAASAERRREFLRAVRAGQIEVSALPMNVTPYLSGRQWESMTRWLPEELWRRVNPRTAVQNDVNGFPRAGAKELLDRGVRYLFSGINADSGGPPLPRLTAFWWRQPDDRRLFVWMSLTYGDGFFFFETDEWRRGPLPRAADGQFRPPRSGDILRTDEASLEAARRQCVKRVRQLEKDGYRHPIVAVSMTSMWRYDNDPPFPPMSDFVAAWNARGWQPRLRLVTATQAMQDLERVAGATAPEHSGEWTDWWANGTACAPREVAASRWAKRYLDAAASPVWGPLDASSTARIDSLIRDLCLFDEHTWGSGMSVGQPYSLDAQGQFNEKARLAWRPMALAEWLLGQRARSRFAGEGEGLWLANPTRVPWSGWATMLSSCLRDDYRSVVDPATGTRRRLEFEPGPVWGRPGSPADLGPEDVSATFPDRSPGRYARFWVEGLPEVGARRLRLSKEADDGPVPAGGGPVVTTDDDGWPSGAVWPGMKRPLFGPGLGDFVGVKVRSFAPRWALQDIWNAPDAETRSVRQKETLEFVPARAGGKAERDENPHTVRFTQRLEHPRLKWATRTLEIWKREARAQLTLRLNRISSFDPELLCVVHPISDDGSLPRTSCGGMGFTPFSDQMPGTCRDYFAIDGWARFDATDGHRVWVTRDAPLMSVDGPHPKSHLGEPPARPGRLVSILYDNVWYTNFQGDSPGVMEFRFEMAWKERLAGDAETARLAEALTTDPVVVLNPSLPEDPLFLKNLFRP